jgi:hypothetical protein
MHPALAMSGVGRAVRRECLDRVLVFGEAHVDEILPHGSGTGRDGRNESGMPVVKAVLIEPENKPKKEFRPMGASRCVAGRG